MKKLLFVVALGAAGLVSANVTAKKLKDEPNVSPKKNVNTKKNKKTKAQTKCEAVETSCGEHVYACGEVNQDGELNWELIDDMRQLGEAVFCN